MMKRNAFNPYLPSWEYIPDGEPHVFGDRLYVYGSHDCYNGYVFCMGDYVCYSAPVSDLSDWRYEGVIYEKTSDPMNRDGSMNLFAPDATQGPDGKFYLYYVLDKTPVVSVAVCDRPAGKYDFLGYVHYEDGTRLGEKAGDEPQFDPGLLTEGNETYLYTGFSGKMDANRHGAMVSVLRDDMLTLAKGPEFILPNDAHAAGTEFEGHAFYEAPSMRKFGGLYYFIYSSELMHELCYATASSPLGPFRYGGAIISNADIGISGYKAADEPVAYGANNHGSLVGVGGKHYIFYHRHTNGSWYCRQGCAEEVRLEADGSISQVELTSCGLNGGPLEAAGEYPAYIACNLFTQTPSLYVSEQPAFAAEQCFPRIMQDGRDGDREEGFIANMKDGATAGFKYFDFKDVTYFSIVVRGYADGFFDLRISYKGPVLASIPVGSSNGWKLYSVDVDFPDGIFPLYLSYRGTAAAALKSFCFGRKEQ